MKEPDLPNSFGCTEGACVWDCVKGIADFLRSGKGGKDGEDYDKGQYLCTVLSLIGDRSQFEDIHLDSAQITTIYYEYVNDRATPIQIANLILQLAQLQRQTTQSQQQVPLSTEAKGFIERNGI